MRRLPPSFVRLKLKKLPTKMYFTKTDFATANIFITCSTWALVAFASVQAQGVLEPAAGETSLHSDLSPDSRWFFLASSCNSFSGKSGKCRSSFGCALAGGMPDGWCNPWLLSLCCISLSITDGTMNTTESTERTSTVEMANLPTVTCRDTFSDEQSMIVNPNYPNLEEGDHPQPCDQVLIINPDTCQVRIDVRELALGPPFDGECGMQGFATFSGNNLIRILCGENRGQHYYFDASNGEGITFSLISNILKKWNILVTQISCNSTELAPEGCDQYFTETTGTISSFAYDFANPSEPNQLNNQDYRVCIKQQPGYCSVTYAQTPGTQFSLSGNLGAGDRDTPVVDADCTEDYITIPGVGSLSAGPEFQGRFCGTAFPGATSFESPFYFDVKTSDSESNDNGNQGFHLTYTLDPCP